MAAAPAIDSRRVLADLRELARRTGDDSGAQRVCWTQTWRDARALLDELLVEIGLEPDRDEAGNLWARLEGADPTAPALAVGSHLDSVPDGGWLDGALGVIAAAGVLRAWSACDEPPPRPLLLVDWADEEGARFGRSLFGSSAFSGSFDPADLATVGDADGRLLGDVLAENGVELGRVGDAAARRDGVGAYLELHIEQGPRLEAAGLSVAAVDGCAGVERVRLRFVGQAAHAGTTPIESRRDAGLAAAETSLAVERIAVDRGGVGTTGALALRPGIPTAIAGEAELSCDLRHRDAAELAAMLEDVIGAARRAATRRACGLEVEPIWRIEPIRFDPDLVALAGDAAREAGGSADPLASGALHDAAELARVLPAAMMFCASAGGLSHTADEDTPEADLIVALDAFSDLVNRALAR